MQRLAVWRNPVHFLAFGFGSGLAPKAPGTFGTLAAIPPYLLMTLLPVSGYLLVVVVAAVLGIYLCGRTARDMGVHDHPGIVWDEFVGFWITMLFVPVQWYWILAGFALFRLFDIWKPWPIRVVDQKVEGGFGIMLDDVLAGIYALLVLQLLLYVF
ncbi:phosphatidylglycerophosphatase A family protein [Marinobacterium sedimentorum]|uniref:phosphatidylglycerophosphatase A family protein n=1 Tax=Marinobacterium sedimentorum TaxID=2927804 RepID=UPI0020C68889|nr:phosphatidylglycerophosphatase A [Marinobacterium sedimentorum]MCP8686112.1 phosphatidylglycerophosphatase A [Marinobacterium sedimentorum]